MACLPRPVMMMIWSQPDARASSTPYWMMGLSTKGSISLGWALVAGKKRVPSPAAGKTALRTRMVNFDCTFCDCGMTNGNRETHHHRGNEETQERQPQRTQTCIKENRRAWRLHRDGMRPLLVRCVL